MAAHTYWRLYITETVGAGGYVAIAEIQMYNASGTLLSTGGTATASSYYTSDPTYAPSKAFDVAISTFWHSNVQPATTPQWIAYQMASAGDVAVVRMTPRSGSPNQGPANFKIQYSDDGSSWTDSITYSGISFTSTWFATGFPATTPSAGAYANWRIYILTSQSGGPPSCAELQFRETTGGADLASTTTWHGQASDVFTSFWGYQAFDDNASTFWAAGNSPPGNWLGNSLHRVVAITEVFYQVRPDASYTQGAATFKVQASNDGTTWTDIGSVFTAATWTSAGQSQTFTVPTAGGAGLLRHPGMDGMRPLMTGGMNG